MPSKSSKSSIISLTKDQKSLFLFEVLVTKIIFKDHPCITDKNFRTCIKISMSGVDTIEIYEDSSDENNNNPYVQHFNRGKSCLFMLNEVAIMQAMSKCQVKVVVVKSLPCGCLPSCVVIGETIIDMTKEFAQARKNYLENPNSCSYQALKDSFIITDANGVQVGDIPMFLRITCFGKNIITKFQAGQDKVNMLGEGAQSGEVNTMKKDEATCVCDTGLGTICPPVKDPFNSMPCEDQEGPCVCPSGESELKNKPGLNSRDCCPPGNKIIFQLPADSCSNGHKQKTHFNFNSNGVGDIEREDPDIKRTDGYSGVVYDFPSQIIKVRVGKTVEMPGRKSKFEYQFITPTGYQAKHIPLTDIGTAQCLPTCNCCSCRKICE